MKRIIIADPHPIVRLGIRERLLQINPNFKIVAQVDSGDILLPKLLQKKPDLVILELNMPYIQGLSILKQIEEKLPKTRIFIYSSFPRDIYENQCLKNGAYAFLSKDTTLTKFSTVIKNLVNKNSKPAKKKKTKSKPIKPLSEREIEVLEYLIRGDRNKDIASALELNEKTVSTYKSRILKKLNATNLADLINHYQALKPNVK